MTLLLMAAGSGSRYGKLKQFDELGPNGEFLMEFGIYDAVQNGFNHIVIVTKQENVSYLDGYLSSKLPEDIRLSIVVQELSDLPLGTDYSGNRYKPWGTAHAVWAVRNVIDEAFAVLNADDFYGKSAYENTARFIKKYDTDNAYALVGYTLKDTLSKNGSVSRGICKTNDGNLVSIEEILKLEQQQNFVLDKETGNTYSGNEMCSMNFWVCRPSLFKVIESKFREFLRDESKIQNSEI